MSNLLKFLMVVVIVALTVLLSPMQVQACGGRGRANNVVHRVFHGRIFNGCGLFHRRCNNNQTQTQAPPVATKQSVQVAPEYLPMPRNCNDPAGTCLLSE